MRRGPQVVRNHPAETLTGISGAAATLVVWFTDIGDERAAALVLVVTALPAVVTAIVNRTRGVAAAASLVALSDDVTALARTVLTEAQGASVALADKTATLKAVTESMAAWAGVVEAQPAQAADANGTAPARRTTAKKAAPKPTTKATTKPTTKATSKRPTTKEAAAP